MKLFGIALISLGILMLGLQQYSRVNSGNPDQVGPAERSVTDMQGLSTLAALGFIAIADGAFLLYLRKNRPSY